MSENLYPDGKLNEEDEGATVMGLAIDQGRIVIAFPKPVAWIAYPPEGARELALALLQKADEAEENVTSS